jgi:hypothetical protein
VVKPRTKKWSITAGISALLAIMTLLGVWIMPFMLPRAAASGQITSRSLTLSSGVPSATGVTYTFTFSTATAGVIQGLKFVACTNAVGTYPGGSCTAPAGMTASGDGFDNAAFASKSGWAPSSNDFAADHTGVNECIASPNVLCAKRTDSSSETSSPHTIIFNTIKNPSTTVASPNGVAFYVGIYTYTTNTWANGTNTDFGATASAVVQTLSASAAVAEILQFCVGSTTVDDTSTLISNDCSSLAGTSLNIGTLDTSTINISPVGVDGGDSKNGVAMVRSNAGNGVVISYDAIQQTGTNHQGTLRINGSSCNTTGDPGADGNGNTKTDPCINAAGPAQTPFIAGTEEFGMTVAGVNNGSTSSYSCQYGYTVPTPTGSATPIVAGNTCDLMPDSTYLGKGTNAADADYGTTNGFAWDETGTSRIIASSSSSTIKQVDDEALIMKFAATPSITTPFGTYTALTDLIAVPTY